MQTLEVFDPTLGLALRATPERMDHWSGAIVDRLVLATEVAILEARESAEVWGHVETWTELDFAVRNTAVAIDVTPFVDWDLSRFEVCVAAVRAKHDPNPITVRVTWDLASSTPPLGECGRLVNIYRPSPNVEVL